MPRQYPQSFKSRAVRVVIDRLEVDDAPSRYTVIRQTAPELGVAVETLRRWVVQAESDTSQNHGATAETQAELRNLKRENAELRRVNQILKRASAYFAAELDRPLN